MWDSCNKYGHWGDSCSPLHYDETDPDWWDRCGERATSYYCNTLDQQKFETELLINTDSIWKNCYTVAQEMFDMKDMTWDEWDAFCRPTTTADKSEFDYIIQGDRDFMTEHAGSSCWNPRVKNLFSEGYELILYEATDFNVGCHETLDFFAPNPARVDENRRLVVKNSCSKDYCTLDLHLPGITIRLQPGDEVPLVIDGGQWLYALRSEAIETWPNNVCGGRLSSPTASPVQKLFVQLDDDEVHIEICCGSGFCYGCNRYDFHDNTRDNIITGSLIGAAIFLLFIFRCWYVRNRKNGTNNNMNRNTVASNNRNRSRNANNNTSNSNNNNNINNNDGILAEKIANMPLEERKTLYQRTFDQKQQEMLVDPSWIIAGDSKQHYVPDTATGAGNKVEDNDDNDDIPLALESMRSTVVAITTHKTEPSSGDIDIDSGDADVNSENDSSSDNDSGILPATTPSATQTSATSAAAAATHNILHPYYVDPNNNHNNTEGGAIAVVPGLCVICLEPMEAGERVVCSENQSCPHLFHRDCMVNFLAHNTQQQESHPRTFKNIGKQNPCPTCRQNFVTVSLSMVQLLDHDRQRQPREDDNSVWSMDSMA